MWAPTLLLAFAASASASAAATTLPCAPPTVRISSTTLTGTAFPALKQEFFGGIPFAQPPVGSLRFQPPVLKTSPGTPAFDARSFGFACLQPGVPAEQLSEDCLTINVWRPAGINSNAKLPVLTWIYGGSFDSGSGSIYNGSDIVLQSINRGTPIIYVNFNYRLGPLGFPQGNEADSRKILNLGLKDQLAALQWIQTNIGAFGGDKTKVTLFGESAGSVSIAIHYLNPSFGKLARAAIFESGSAASPLINQAAARQVDWSNFVGAVPGCTSLASSANTLPCLRSASTASILQGIVAARNAGTEFIIWPPALDGPGGVYPDLPSRLFAKGTFARLPFIAGTNLDEGTVFTTPFVNYTPEITKSILVANLTPSFVPQGEFNDAVNRVMDLYPEDPSFGSPIGTGNETFGLSPEYKRVAIIVNDLAFQSQRRYWMDVASKVGVPTFGYLFTDPQPQYPPQYGVPHQSEVPYLYPSQASNPSPSAPLLSKVMIDYWVAFTNGLNPNDGRGSQRPVWPQYTQGNKVIMQLNGVNTTVIPDNYRAAQIANFNADPVAYHHRRAFLD